MKFGYIIRLKGLVCIGIGLGIMCFGQQSYAFSYNLKIELSPAVCLLDSSQQKRRKCLEGYPFTIIGLFPETTQNCVTATSAKLPPLQAQVISRVMPNEFVRQQVWTQVGGCEAGDASQYFRKIVNLAQNLNIPSEVRPTQAYTTSQQYIKNKFIQLNSALPPDGLQLSCQKRGKKHYLTQIQVCYDQHGRYKNCSVPQTKNSCPSNMIIQGSY